MFHESPELDNVGGAGKPHSSPMRLALLETYWGNPDGEPAIFQHPGFTYGLRQEVPRRRSRAIGERRAIMDGFLWIGTQARLRDLMSFDLSD